MSLFGSLFGETKTREVHPRKYRASEIYDPEFYGAMRDELGHINKFRDYMMAEDPTQKRAMWLNALVSTLPALHALVGTNTASEKTQAWDQLFKGLTGSANQFYQHGVMNKQQAMHAQHIANQSLSGMLSHDRAQFVAPQTLQTSTGGIIPSLTGMAQSGLMLGQGMGPMLDYIRSFGGR